MLGKPIIQFKAMKKIKIQTSMLLLYMMKIKKYIKHIYKNNLNLRFLQVENMLLYRVRFLILMIKNV